MNWRKLCKRPVGNSVLWISLLALPFIALTCLHAPACAASEPEPAASAHNPAIRSLDELSIRSLRARSYGSTFTILKQLGDTRGESGYAHTFGPPYYDTYLLGYQSDGLHVLSRLDVPPTSRLSPGKPVPLVIFAHGWVGEEKAPTYALTYSADAYYGDMIDALVKAGFAVLSPGYRGHGNVDGKPADGIEWMRAYDNGSYLSPQFYAIDILNALESIDSLPSLVAGLKVDAKCISLLAHSQGGDAALTTLTVASSPTVHHPIAHAAIWAGTFAARTEQLRYYGGLEYSKDAAGDPRFFPVMPDWWDSKSYKGSIDEGIAERRRQMYDTVRRFVLDRSDADPALHPVEPAMAAIDAIAQPGLIDADLELHYGTMDYYSPPRWNEELATGMRAAGKRVTLHEYAGNNHEFRVVPNWSPASAKPGRADALASTLALFRCSAK